MLTDDDVFEPGATRQPTIIAVYNQKGGVGKTTSSVNLALCLAAMGKSVVLVDFDPQSSATSNFIFDRKSKVGIHDLLNRDAFVEDAIVPTAFEGLSMIVGARKLFSLEHALDGRGSSQRGLRKALHFSRGAPDYVVIDCPPALGHLAAGALAAADQLVLPVFPGRYALDGLRKTLSVVEHIQKGMNPALTLAGVAMLSVSNDEVGRDSVTQLRAECGDLMFRTVVPYDQDVVKATYQRMPAAVFSPKARSTQRFVALAAELAHGRGHTPTDADLQAAVDRLQSWHDATMAAYADAERQAAGMEPSGPAGRDDGPTAPARRSPAGAAAAALAGAVGLAVGFALGAVFGAPVATALIARLGG